MIREAKMSSYAYKEPTVRYRVLTTFALILFILIIIFGSFFIAPIIGRITFYLTIFLLLALLIFLRSKHTAYLCKNCDHEFEISFWRDLISANSPGKKLLKCPKCLYKDYASELVKTKINKNDEV
jgi:DNA-directed RNA polymerase subunit RPC12/RpoP